VPGLDDDAVDVTPSGRCPTADGVSVAYYDMGGTGPPLVLVHATGFCAAVLAPLARALGARFHSVALDLRAHGRSHPPPSGDFDWHGFALDVLAVVGETGLERPVGFGHSAGGAALLLAEQARPGTFSGLYLFEPVVYPGDVALTPMFDNNPMSSAALRRREVFGSRAEAIANFSSKAPLNRLHPEALAAYVDNGFAPDGDGGMRLRCRREDEAAIYAHGFSHDAYRHLADVRCPVTLACGADTDEFGTDFLSLFAARLDHAEVVVLPGLGHFGPLQNPPALAASLAGSLAGSLAASPPGSAASSPVGTDGTPTS